MWHYDEKEVTVHRLWYRTFKRTQLSYLLHFICLRYFLPKLFLTEVEKYAGSTSFQCSSEPFYQGTAPKLWASCSGRWEVVFATTLFSFSPSICPHNARDFIFCTKQHFSKFIWFSTSEMSYLAGILLKILNEVTEQNVYFLINKNYIKSSLLVLCYPQHLTDSRSQAKKWEV